MPNIILIIAFAASLALVILLLLKLILVKTDLRQMRKELTKTRDESYNRILRVSLIDSDVEKLAGEINKNIEYQKNLKLETQKSRKQLEQSMTRDDLGKGLVAAPSGGDGVQMSFFKLDDPVLIAIRDEFLGLDINSLTPLEALNKLNSIQKLVKGVKH